MGQRHGDVLPTRHGLALASYLEKQDTRRAANKWSAAAMIRRLFSRGPDRWARPAADLHFEQG
jgi:hypothetical protein